VDTTNLSGGVTDEIAVEDAAMRRIVVQLGAWRAAAAPQVQFGGKQHSD